MTNTIHVHARKISSFVLNGLIALFLITSGCSSDGEGSSKLSEARNRATAPLAVTSVPAPEPVVMEAPAEEALLEVKEEAPRMVTYAEAEVAFNEKNYTEALNLFTQYTTQKADNPWGFYMLGLSAHRAGDLDAAKTAYHNAIALDSSHVKSWTNLSRTLIAGGEDEEAITALDKALALDPDMTDVYRLRGRAFDNLNQHNEAITSYKQAIVLDETDVWSMNNLALVYIEEQQFDSALPVLALAVQLNDKEAVFFNNLGMVLEHHGYMLAAADAYKKATEADISNSKASDNLARVSEVKEKGGLAPLDLTVLAAEFQAEIDAWQMPAEEWCEDEEGC